MVRRTLEKEAILCVEASQKYRVKSYLVFSEIDSEDSSSTRFGWYVYHPPILLTRQILEV